MPETHPSEATAAAAAPAALAAAQALVEEPDYLLGCECADPALQIERWRQECGVAGASG